MNKGLLVVAGLLGGAAACASGGNSTPRVIVPEAESQAVASDDVAFAATDPNPGRQSISVSFFAGHIGPVSSGSAHWTQTDSNDSDPFSVEIDVPEGGTPANGFSSFAGINFHHVPAQPPPNAPSFDFKANRSGDSGGSPRLVMVFSEGGNINLRPLTWVQNTWISEGGPDPTPDPLAATNWDNVGGTCGFRFEQTYQAALACHAGTTVTAAFIVSDSGWLNAPYQNWIDNIQYGGRTISQPSDNTN
ncbi:MAG: hypothetical protein ABR567_00855 [Myxococcales bacterium]